MPNTKAKGYIKIDTEYCKGCEACLVYCPAQVIALSEKTNTGGYQYAEFDDSGACTGCAVCALVCPEAAIEVYRG